MKKLLFGMVLAVALVGILMIGREVMSPASTNYAPAASFDKHRYSLTDPSSLWVVVNKVRSLNPIDYAPGDLATPAVPLRNPGDVGMQMRQSAATALEQLFKDAKAAGLDLMITSAYRSYVVQKQVYASEVSGFGQTQADRESARPGYSEHQTGLAVDLEPASHKCSLDTCFGTTPEGQWLTANAYKYGFIVRYPADKESVTGYKYEPWHVRYIGTDLAGELHTKHITTLEEFFQLPSATDYAT